MKFCFRLQCGRPLDASEAEKHTLHSFIYMKHLKQANIEIQKNQLMITFYDRAEKEERGRVGDEKGL